jgi:hypothetical protein
MQLLKMKLIGIMNEIRFISGMKKKKEFNSGGKEYQVKLLIHHFYK